MFETIRNLFTCKKFDSFKSDIPAVTSGFLIGHCTDSGNPVCLDDDIMSGHLLMMGAVGVGKTIVGHNMVEHQIQRGGGLLFIDAKAYDEELKKIYHFCAKHGREKDLLVLNLRDPLMSNTWNPLLVGTPTEIASRVMTLAPPGENNADAGCRLSTAFMGVFSLVSGLQAAGQKFNFLDLSILLQSASAMKNLDEKVKIAKGIDSDECRAFALFMDSLKTPGKEGSEAVLDMKKFKDMFGGLATRMCVFGSDNFGEVMNTYTPEINLLEAIQDNKIIYAMLPTMGNRDAALAVGKMLVASLNSCAALLCEMPSEQRPTLPFFCFKDEAFSYADESWNGIYQQIRAANIILMSSAQTTYCLDGVSGSFFSEIAGNIRTKIVLKTQDRSSIERTLSLIGGNSGTSVVTPDMIFDLAAGEAFVFVSQKDGSVSTFKVKIPYTPVPKIDAMPRIVHKDELVSI